MTPTPTPVPRLMALASLIVLVVLIAGCAASGPSPSPAPSVARVDTPQGAVDAVRARIPLFDGFGPKDPDLIGQGTFWTAVATGVTWQVTFETGWGDCQAGCIDRHTWAWTVAADGAIAFVAEAGPALPEGMLEAMQAASTRTGLAGRATGGPTCPVEQPGDPSCVPRLVGGVVLVVTGGGGAEIARVTTDGSGLFRLALPPGDYTLEAPAVEGFMSGPGPTPFTVQDGTETWLDLAWDTGIR